MLQMLLCKLHRSLPVEREGQSQQRSRQIIAETEVAASGTRAAVRIAAAAEIAGAAAGEVGAAAADAAALAAVVAAAAAVDAIVTVEVTAEIPKVVAEVDHGAVAAAEVEVDEEIEAGDAEAEEEVQFHQSQCPTESRQKATVDRCQQASDQVADLCRPIAWLLLLQLQRKRAKKRRSPSGMWGMTARVRRLVVCLIGSRIWRRLSRLLNQCITWAEAPHQASHQTSTRLFVWKASRFVR